MREIKFRAWDKAVNSTYLPHMVEISAMDISEGGIIDGVRVFTTKPEHSYTLPIEDCVLMQYTGLKDKNGKEIYEGDIVKRDGANRLRNTYIVEWQQYRMRTGFNISAPSGKVESLEVIGNIYEKPGLLNV